MKIKKLIFTTGFISTSFLTVFLSNKLKFEKNVLNHSTYNKVHDGIIIAHRGFSSIYVENSAKAVKKGFELPCCDGVEVDVRLTKDGKVVLSHDPYVNGIGLINDCKYKDIKNDKYSSEKKMISIKSYLMKKDGNLLVNRTNTVQSSEEKISLLTKVVDDNNCNKILIVDIKFDDDEEVLMDKINNIFEDYNECLNIIFQSDNYKELSLMKEKFPNYDYQLIIKKNKDLKYLDSEFNYFCIRKNLITKDLVDDAKKNNNRICVWTINSYDDYKSLKKKLDDRINDVYIISDYPDEICYLNNKTLRLKK